MSIVEALQALLPPGAVLTGGDALQAHETVFLGGPCFVGSAPFGAPTKRSWQPMYYGEVTVTSPMGEALMKARIGEVVRVNAPRGTLRFEVVEIL